MSKVYYADSCPTCNHPAHSPSRHFENGRVTHGCIDHFHTGHLEPGSESECWHNRPVAVEMRERAKARRGGAVTEQSPNL